MGMRRDRSRDRNRTPVTGDPFAIGETLRRGEGMIRMGRTAGAARLLRAVLAAHPHCEPAALMLGHIERRRGRLVEAAALLRRVLAQRPDCATAMAELGECALVARRPEEACLWFWRAVAADGRNAAACRRLGDALGALDRPTDAESCRMAARAMTGSRDHYGSGGVRSKIHRPRGRASKPAVRTL